MGQSTDGILAYGFDLGGGDGAWKVKEYDKDEWQLKADWYDPERKDKYGDEMDVEEQAIVRLYAANGTPFPNGYVDGDDTMRDFGVRFLSYCSCEYPMYILSTFDITCSRGDTEPVDFMALEQQRVEGDWNGKLARAVASLGLTPNDPPRWLLASMWC